MAKRNLNNYTDDVGIGIVSLFLAGIVGLLINLGLLAGAIWVVVTVLRALGVL